MVSIEEIANDLRRIEDRQKIANLQIDKRLSVLESSLDRVESEAESIDENRLKKVDKEVDEIRKQKEGGLKSYNPDPPAGWLEVMGEKVSKPLLQEELAKCGDVGQQMVTAIEEGLGRKLR